MVAGEKLAKRYILTLCQSYFQALNFIFLGISATKNLCKPLKYCTINASWWKTQYLNPHCSKSAYIQPETKKCLNVANSSFFLIWPCHRAWKIIVPPLQELNLHPWQWKRGVQTTGPSGIPKYWQFFTRNQYILCISLDIKYKYILSLYKTLKKTFIPKI